MSFAGCAALAAALVLIPIPFLAAWLTAAMIHELGHIAAVYLCGGQILSFRFSPGGAVLESDIITKCKVIICCLAGPAASFLVYVLFPAIPLLSQSGLLQGMMNLLPIPAMDGGRCLDCILSTLLPVKLAAFVLRLVHILTICLLLWLSCLGFYFCLIPAGFAIARCFDAKKGCK